MAALGTRTSKPRFRFGPRDQRSSKLNVILDAILFVPSSLQASSRVKPKRLLSALEGLLKQGLPVIFLSAHKAAQTRSSHCLPCWNGFCSSVNSPTHIFVGSHVCCFARLGPFDPIDWVRFHFLGLRVRGMFTALYMLLCRSACVSVWFYRSGYARVGSFSQLLGIALCFSSKSLC